MVIVAILWAVVEIVLLTVNLASGRSYIANEVTTARDVRIVVYVLGYVINLFMIYAECVYVSEVRKGIVTKETHSREKYWW